MIEDGFKESNGCIHCLTIVEVFEDFPGTGSGFGTRNVVKDRMVNSGVEHVVCLIVDCIPFVFSDL